MNLGDRIAAAARVPRRVVDRSELGDRLSLLFHPTTYAPLFDPAVYSLVDRCSPLILDRDDLERRCQANGSIQYYDRPRVAEITPPDGDDPPEKLAERTGTFSIPEPFVGVLENASLLGAYPVPVVDRQLVLEAVVSPEVMTLNGVYSLRDLLGELPGVQWGPTEPLDSAVLLYNRWNAGYFHWTIETLTRLEGVEQYRRRTGERPTLIVGPDPSRFQLESLALLGYEEADLLRWDSLHRSVDRLVVPSVRREFNQGDVSPVAYQWLQERMHEAVSEDGPDGSEFSNRVYISRDDADYRQVRNEDAVMAMLADYGFEKYVLTESSMAEDVALFEQADVIVSPHGAGLTNILYAEDASVIELFRSNYIQPVYFVLANQLGHRYRSLLCAYEGTDIVVDVEELEAAVTAELDARENDTTSVGAAER